MRAGLPASARHDLLARLNRLVGLAPALFLELSFAKELHVSRNPLPFLRGLYLSGDVVASSSQGEPICHDEPGHSRQGNHYQGHAPTSAHEKKASNAASRLLGCR